MTSVPAVVSPAMDLNAQTARRTSEESAGA